MLSGLVFTTLIMFWYSYLKMTNSNFIKLLSNFWFFSFTYATLMFVVVIFFLLPFSNDVLFTAEAKLIFNGSDTKIQELIRNEPLVFAIDVSFLEFGNVGKLGVCLG
jgi:hypothetical protein